MRFLLIIISIICLLPSCAVKYRPIRMEHLSYLDTVINNNKDLQISTSTVDIFLESGNKRIAKKAHKKKLVFVPMHVCNLGIDTFYFENRSFEVFNDFEPVDILEKDGFYKKIRQNPGLYLLESGLAGSAALILSGGTFSILVAWYNIYNIPFYSGFYNTYKAYKANGALYRNISDLNILDKKIAPNQTCYVIICLKTANYNNLMIRIK